MLVRPGSTRCVEPPQQIVAERGGLGFRVRLAGEFIQHVVDVGPRAHVGIGAGELAPAQIVGVDDDVARWIGDRGEIAKRVIGVSRVVAERIGDGGHQALIVADSGRGLAEIVGGARRQAVEGVSRVAAVRESRLRHAGERVVGIDGPFRRAAGKEIRPAGLRDAAQRVVLGGGPDPAGRSQRAARAGPVETRDVDVLHAG